MVIENVTTTTGDAMDVTDEPQQGEAYGETAVNDRGRLTIPKDLRDALHIDGGTRFTVVREGSDIRLVRQLPELQTLSSGKSREEWGEEAFRDAGEATFGGN